MHGEHAAPLSENELVRRLPVWTALTELFLDTELDARDYRRIAEMIRAAGYSGDEAWRILDTEVFPAFAPNLLSVAGEWAGWPAETVKRVVLAHRARDAVSSTLHQLLTRPLLARHVRAEWVKLEDLLRQLGSNTGAIDPRSRPTPSE